MRNQFIFLKGFENCSEVGCVPLIELQYDSFGSAPSTYCSSKQCLDAFRSEFLLGQCKQLLSHNSQDILKMKEIFVPYTFVSIIILFIIHDYGDYRLIKEGLVEDNESPYLDEHKTKYEIGLLIVNVTSSFQDICEKWKKTVTNPSMPEGCDLSSTCVLYEDLYNLTSSLVIEYQDEALDQIVKFYKHYFHS